MPSAAVAMPMSSVSWPLAWAVTPDRRMRARTIAKPAARLVALDGLRGILALMVAASHYIGEVPHGVKLALVGWIAVKMFFVLSGFLMAKVIVDHIGTPGFFATFYMRRACRTLPVYFVTLALALGAAQLFQGQVWVDADRLFPLWRYLTFTQTFEMIARGDHGSTWMTPTWTLTVEEQFYLVAPILCRLAGRRHLMKALCVAAAASVAFRLLSFGLGVLPDMAALVLLPGVAHSMFIGMITALLLASNSIDLSRYDVALRVSPLLILGVVMLAKIIGGDAGALYQCVGVPLVSVGCALYLASIVRGAPEALRLRSSVLGALGRLSFGVYLLHMPVLGLMHGLILGGKPDIATVAEFGVTLAAMPVTLGLAWAVNRCVEEPMITYGRKWVFVAGEGNSEQ